MALLDVQSEKTKRNGKEIFPNTELSSPKPGSDSKQHNLDPDSCGEGNSCFVSHHFLARIFQVAIDLGGVFAVADLKDKLDAGIAERG